MATRGRPRHPDILTPREWEVLALLREGLTNEQIAERLGTTVRTARFHVSEILSKLSVSNREEAARWQPEEPEQPRAFAFAPLTFLRAYAWAAATIVIVTATAGVSLLAWGMTRTDGGTSVVTASPERTSVPLPAWQVGDTRIAASQSHLCGDIDTAETYGVPPMLEATSDNPDVRPLRYGLEAVPYDYVPAQVRRVGGYPWSADGWELSRRPDLIPRRPMAAATPVEYFLHRRDEPVLLFRYAGELCEQPDGDDVGPSPIYLRRQLELPPDLPNVITRREGDYISAEEAMAIATHTPGSVDTQAIDGQRAVWAELGSSHDFARTRNQEIQFPPLYMDPDKDLWVVLVDAGDNAGPQRAGHSIGYYYRIDPLTGGIAGYGCCLGLIFAD